MSKLIEVRVTREQESSVFLLVDEDFKGWPTLELLRKAVEATINDYEWENDERLSTLEMESVHEIDERDANGYSVFDAR